MYKDSILMNEKNSCIINVCVLLVFAANTEFRDNSNPRVGADHGVDFDWSRQSRHCPDVSAKILNSVQLPNSVK